MKAEEIRDAAEPIKKLLLLSCDKLEQASRYMNVLILHEIAAQLAELNESLASFATGESEPDPWGQGDSGPVKRVFHVRSVE